MKKITFTWCFPVLIFLVFLSPVVSSAKLQGQARLDSFLKELESPRFKNTEDTFKVTLLAYTSLAYNTINPREGIKYGIQCAQLAEKLNYKVGTGKAYRALCYNHYRMGNFDTAISFGFKAVEIYKQADPKALADNYGIIGACYKEKSDFTKALTYFFEAAKMAEASGIKRVQAQNLNQIGSVYNLLYDNDKSIMYMNAALKLHEQTGDSVNMNTMLVNLTTPYSALGKFDTCLTLIDRALPYFKSKGLTHSVAFALGCKGNVYRQKKDPINAIKYLAEALSLFEQIGDKQQESTFLLHMGAAYIDWAEGNYKNGPPGNRTDNANKAIQCFEKALKIAIELNSRYAIMETRQNLAKAYAIKGDYKTALSFAEAYKSISDSIFSNDNKLKIAALETQRESDLKNKQIEINRIQESSKKKERWLFVIGAALLLGIIILIYNTYLGQKQASDKLSLANKQLADEKSKLETANRLLNDEQQKSNVLTADLKESLVQKEELAMQLSQAVEMKTKFLANISHELRTPVTLLTGMLELIKDKSDNKAGHSGKKLEVAYTSSRKLQYMVEEILDLSRLETRQAKVDLQIKEVAPVIKRMVYAFESLVEKEQLTLGWTEENILDVFVSVDEQLLEKVVNNLVYNAIKFNVPNGWIRASLSLTADRSHFIFTIRNSGKGIKADDLPHVFDRYYQGLSAAKAEGMGIGLALVKEFTSLMGGTVSVSSTAASGTAFTLSFPVTNDRPQEANAEEDMPPVAEDEWRVFPRKHNVLLVEDNAEMRYYLKEVLDGKVNIAEAGNGREALKWLEHNQPDLIITDIMMPELDGREFVAELKKSEIHRKVPVITLTALADKENQLGMLRMGVDDYIVKPFNATELQVRVYNLLKNLEERKQFTEQQPAEPEEIVPDSREADEFRNKITEYVLARMKTVDVSVYDLAYHLAMSERQLYRMAKTLTGCTPALLVKEVRLQKAYELLLSGQIYKIDDVAKRVGFENTSYFSRQFYERFGKRPTEFL